MRTLFPTDGLTVQRAVVDGYNRWIRKPLSRGVVDWAITDAECMRVVRSLTYLSDGDLLDTYNRMQSDGLWATLYSQTPSDSLEWHDLRWRLVRLGQPVLGKSAEDKRLAKLQSALNGGKRAAELARAAATDPKLRSQLARAAAQFDLAASTLGKGLDLESAARSTHKLAKAASRISRMDVGSDGEAAAEAFGALFSAAGELGGFLPPGPWTPYFDFLTGFDDFFTNMRHTMDHRNQGGGRFRAFTYGPRS